MAKLVVVRSVKLAVARLMAKSRVTPRMSPPITTAMSVRRQRCCGRVCGRTLGTVWWLRLKDWAAVHAATGH